MRNVFLIFVVFTICFSAYGQDNFKIYFVANEEATINLYEKWNYNYTDMSKPLAIDFDGKRLKMFYVTSGNVYLELPVISFEYKESKDYDKKNGDITILKVQRDEMIQYISIERKLYYDKWVNTLKLPYFNKNKEFIAYHYFQFFE